MRGVDADEFGEDEVEFEAETVESFAQYAVGGLSLFVCVGPGVNERAD